MPDFDLDAALNAPSEETEPVEPSAPVDLTALHQSELGTLLLNNRGRTLFYPASYDDWQPMIRLSHLCDTFLYCDLGMTQGTFLSGLPGNHFPHDNLRLLDLQSIADVDLSLFENAETAVERMFPNAHFAHRYQPRMGQIASLEVRMGDSVRPITLIFLNQEGIAAYHGIYSSRNVSPRVICRTDNGFMELARWEEPLGLLVQRSREQPEFLLDGTDRHRRNNWPWPNVWQLYPRLIPGRLEGCCYSKENRPAMLERRELQAPGRTGERSISLRQEELHSGNIDSAEAVLITHKMSRNVVWPPDKAVIVIQRRHYVRSNHLHESVLFSEADEGPTMRSTLDALTCFCRVRGIKRVASVPFGFEHEGRELADWLGETGSELHITFYCATPGDYHSLSNQD